MNSICYKDTSYLGRRMFSISGAKGYYMYMYSWSEGAGDSYKGSKSQVIGGLSRCHSTSVSRINRRKSYSWSGSISGVLNR
jgi:hypothetical protein